MKFSCGAADPEPLCLTACARSALNVCCCWVCRPPLRLRSPEDSVVSTALLMAPSRQGSWEKQVCCLLYLCRRAKQTQVSMFQWWGREEVGRVCETECEDSGFFQGLLFSSFVTEATGLLCSGRSQEFLIATWLVFSPRRTEFDFVCCFLWKPWALLFPLSL